MEDFDESEMADTSRALFMMATYGEGEPTDNAAPFMKWAQNEDGELASDALQGMQYAVFGLGNREYEVSVGEIDVRVPRFNPAHHGHHRILLSAFQRGGEGD